MDSRLTNLQDLVMIRQIVHEGNSGATDKAYKGIGKEFDAGGDMAYLRAAKYARKHFGAESAERYLKKRKLHGKAKPKSKKK